MEEHGTGKSKGKTHVFFGCPICFGTFIVRKTKLKKDKPASR
jgi:hypothetical protein